MISSARRQRGVCARLRQLPPCTLGAPSLQLLTQVREWWSRASHSSPACMQVEVFRRLYEMVGMGWVYAVTKVPGVGPAADAVYDLWAKYRLPITGRPDLLEVVRRRTANANCRDERTAQTSAAGPAADNKQQ